MRLLFSPVNSLNHIPFIKDLDHHTKFKLGTLQNKLCQPEAHQMIVAPRFQQMKRNVSNK